MPKICPDAGVYEPAVGATPACSSDAFAPVACVARTFSAMSKGTALSAESSRRVKRVAPGEEEEEPVERKEVAPARPGCSERRASSICCLKARSLSTVCMLDTTDEGSWTKALAPAAAALCFDKIPMAILTLV